MANWNKIMDAYESNDCDSLAEYADEYFNELYDYFCGYQESKKAAFLSVLCGVYFVNIDNFYDGAEEDVIIGSLGRDWGRHVYTLQKEFDRNNYGEQVEREIRSAPYRIKETFARLGCCICSAKGYISEQEKRVILKWV